MGHLRESERSNTFCERHEVEVEVEVEVAEEEEAEEKELQGARVAQHRIFRVQGRQDTYLNER